MKMLTVPLLVCAVMTLTRAAAVHEAEPGETAAPLIEDGQSAAPLIEDGESAPLIEDGESAPLIEDGESAAPLIEDGQSAAPLIEDGESAAPLIEDGKSVRVKRSASCHGRWTKYKGRCFLFFLTPMTWADAERNCQYRGGNLASVYNLGEYRRIQGMILRRTLAYPHTWLGGSDAEQERTWFWSDGKPFRFNYWAPGEPNNSRNEDCLLMNFGDHKKFNDVPCYLMRPFVCAKKP